MTLEIKKTQVPSSVGYHTIDTTVCWLTHYWPVPKKIRHDIPHQPPLARQPNWHRCLSSQRGVFYASHFKPQSNKPPGGVWRRAHNFFGLPPWLILGPALLPPWLIWLFPPLWRATWLLNFTRPWSYPFLFFLLQTAIKPAKLGIFGFAVSWLCKSHKCRSIKTLSFHASGHFGDTFNILV